MSMRRGGGDGGEDMPVPMPNTEAKLPRGDNSPSGEGSALPLFLFINLILSNNFIIFGEYLGRLRNVSGTYQLRL